MAMNASMQEFGEERFRPLSLKAGHPLLSDSLEEILADVMRTFPRCRRRTDDMTVGTSVKRLR